MRYTREIIGTEPKIDNDVYSKNFRRRGKTHAERVEMVTKKGLIDYVAAYAGMKESQLVQFSICNEAMGVRYGEDKWDDGMQLSLVDKDGIRHYKSSKLVGRPTFICEKRCFYSESGWMHHDAEGHWHYEQLLADDDYLNGKKVAAAYERLAELNGDTLTGKLQIKQVSLKVDGKSPFSTAAWVQTVENVKGATLSYVTLFDNGKVLRLTPNEVGGEDLKVPEMGYLRTKFNWLQNWGCGFFVRIK